MKKNLFFSLFLTACLSGAFSQSPTDTISTQKVFGGYQYYQGINRLGFSQMINLMHTNEEAYSEIRSAQTNSFIASLTGYVGGFMLGWPIGTAIGGGRPNWAMAGAGAGILAVGIAINHRSNRQTANAIRIYNESIRSESFRENVRFEYLLSGNGFGLRMTF